MCYVVTEVVDVSSNIADVLISITSCLTSQMYIARNSTGSQT